MDSYLSGRHVSIGMSLSWTVVFNSRFAIVTVLTALMPSACLLSVRPAAAQGSHAYASLGVGATDLSGGVAWLLPKTPVAVGGEYGLGNLFWASMTASYQPFARPSGRKANPFLQVSVTAVGSSPYNGTGVSLGGGVVWWARRRLGFRAEAIKFWPTFTEDVAPTAPDLSAFEPPMWAVRGGVAFRF
jgi:hypothetical protein